MINLLRNTYFNIVIIVLIHIIFSILFVDFNDNLNVLIILITDITMLYCMSNELFKTHNSSKLLFNELFLTAFAAAVLTAIFRYVYLEINSCEIDKSLNLIRAEMIKQEASQEDIATVLTTSKRFINPLVLAIVGLVGYLMSGIIGSFIWSRYFGKK